MLPGQWWLDESVHRLGGELALGRVEHARVALDEVLDEAGDLLAPLAQRRHQDR